MVVMLQELLVLAQSCEVVKRQSCQVNACSSTQGGKQWKVPGRAAASHYNHNIRQDMLNHWLSIQWANYHQAAKHQEGVALNEVMKKSSLPTQL